MQQQYFLIFIIYLSFHGMDILVKAIRLVMRVLDSYKNMTQPVVQPVQPVVQPAGLPVQPVGLPVQPVGLPVQPVGLPVQPVGLPVQPVVQPVQPVQPVLQLAPQVLTNLDKWLCFLQALLTALTGKH